MDEPTVSVLLSVYNDEAFVREAVESIRRQTFEDWELVVVDDGSTDDTPAILDEQADEDERVRVLRNEANRGLTRSLNKGLEACRGRHVARQDADDRSYPTRLERQVAFLEAHDDVGLLGTGYHRVDEDGEVFQRNRHPTDHAGIRWQLLFHNAFCHTSVLLRRTHLDRLDSWYDETLPYSQDYELWTRMAKRTRCANLPTALVAHRTHSAAISEERTEDQQRIADRISAREIGHLAPELGADEPGVRELRTWFYDPPADWTDRRVLLLDRGLGLARRFVDLEEVEPGKAREAVGRWLARLLARRPISLAAHARGRSVAARTLGAFPRTLLRRLPVEAARRLAS